MKINSPHLRGKLHFFASASSYFSGPIIIGFRPIAYVSSVHAATSVSIVECDKIFPGETKLVELVLLDPGALEVPLVLGLEISIGSTVKQIGTFAVGEMLGFWAGDKVP